jgi:cell wall-associated NlpC family hydrolase
MSDSVVRPFDSAADDRLQSPSMPIQKAFHGALLAATAQALVALSASALLVPTAAHAADVDPTDASVAAEHAPSHNIFTSWFGAARQETASVPERARSQASDLVVNALGLIGIHYRFGGNSPDAGFDCSGMVRYVFQNALGLDLPRRAEEISRVGVKVDRDELKPGDLVFYHTLKKTFSHVGIYLGNNRFIHAPSAGGSVRVEDMNESYWQKRFNGARRVD